MAVAAKGAAVKEEGKAGVATAAAATVAAATAAATMMDWNSVAATAAAAVTAAAKAGVAAVTAAKAGVAVTAVDLVEEGSILLCLRRGANTHLVPVRRLRQQLYPGREQIPVL